MKDQAPEKQARLSDKCSRPYRLRQRETAMEATRMRILAAAREIILSEHALVGFSMDAVARHAGITRMTVYHHFGSKRGVLEALFDTMGTRGQLGERLPQVFAHPDALEALRAYIDTFCDFWDSDRVLNRRLRGVAVLDTDFAAAIAARYERRHQAITRLLRRLRDQGVAQASVEREHVVQTLLALTSFEFYDVLAGERHPQHVAPIVWQLVLAAMELQP